MPRPADAPVYVDLSARHRRFLVVALRQWGGPVSATDALAGTVGLDDASALYAELGRLEREIDDGEALTGQDWMRAVLFAGLVVSSQEIGAPMDWHACTGQDLEEAWDDLASVERVLRARFLAPPRRTMIFSGVHDGRRTRVWTFGPVEQAAEASWPEHVGAALGQASARHLSAHGQEPGPDLWLDVRLDRRSDGSVRPFGFFTNG